MLVGITAPLSALFLWAMFIPEVRDFFGAGAILFAIGAAAGVVYLAWKSIKVKPEDCVHEDVGDKQNIWKMAEDEDGHKYPLMRHTVDGAVQFLPPRMADPVAEPDQVAPRREMRSAAADEHGASHEPDPPPKA